MKKIAQTLLGFVFVVLFVLELFFITFRFQILNKNFWITSMREGNVYQKIETEFTTYIEENFTKQGNAINEGKELSKAFKADSIQDFLEKNVEHIFAYVNDETPDIIVYIPLDRFPADLREHLQINSNEVSLDYLISTYGKSSTPIGEEAFTNLRTINRNLPIPMITVTISLIAIFAALVKLEENGSRFIGVWGTLTASGIITFVLIVLINQLANYLLGINSEGDIGGQLIAAVIPSLSSQIAKLWGIVGIAAILSGIPFLALRKNKSARK